MNAGTESVFPIYQVDAFADRPFSGNPAGVCFLMGRQSEEWMQSFAAEMNLSETAFFMRKGDGFTLRWFTPQSEVDLCGHATLATAHIIWETDLLSVQEEIRFETKSGLLRARKDGEFVVLDFPAEPAEAVKAPKGLDKVLGSAIVWCGKNRMDFIVELENEAAVRGLKPDFAGLEALKVRGLIATAKAEDGQSRYDFVSRFFAPLVGIPEDPVTGSAHCCLAPYWGAKLGRSKLTGFQASARGGTVHVCNRGHRVELKGKAFTVFQGVITAAASL